MTAPLPNFGEEFWDIDEGSLWIFVDMTSRDLIFIGDGCRRFIPIKQWPDRLLRACRP